LLIDLDYQGSLSATVLRTVGKVSYSEADKLLAGALSAADVISPSRALAPRLPNITLIPGEFEVNRQETRMLMRWLLKAETNDPRFALARLLASAEMKGRFDVVIVDTPPRLGLATVNSLCASTDVVIPVILDGASVANVQALIGQLKTKFKEGLNPRISLAGIVGMMTVSSELNGNEKIARDTAEKAAQDQWAEKAGGVGHIAGLARWPTDAYVLRDVIPDTARFREDAGRDIAYLDQRASNDKTRAVVDAVGAELARRIGLSSKRIGP
jgi:cellulose biosynthesis protein BcsQ